MESEEGGNKTTLSIKDLFAKIQENLEKQGAFHVGKCHGKSTVITTAGGGGGNSRLAKDRVRNSPGKTSLFQSQLPYPIGPSPGRATDSVDVEAFDTTPSRSPSPQVEDDSKPPPYIPVCMRKKASLETLPTSSSMRGVSSLKPSSPTLSWATPSSDTGLGLSSVGIALSESKKRSRDDIIAHDEKANTATAKIAAAAAAASALDSFFYTSGPRFTREEADEYASFADKWIPTGDKKARRDDEND